MAKHVMGTSGKVADDDNERRYADAIQAQLGERVTNLGRRQSDFESEMRSGFTQMETALSGLANETRNSLAALSSTINERNKPQWQALGFALTFCIALGALVYWPINSATQDLKASVSLIMDKMVTQSELAHLQERSTEDRQGAALAIANLRDKQVPREEHQTHWEAEAQQNAQLQKQIDELRANQAQTYSARDIIMELQEGQKRLEKEVRSSRPGGS